MVQLAVRREGNGDLTADTEPSYPFAVRCCAPVGLGEHATHGRVVARAWPIVTQPTPVQVPEGTSYRLSFEGVTSRVARRRLVVTHRRIPDVVRLVRDSIASDQVHQSRQQRPRKRSAWLVALRWIGDIEQASQILGGNAQTTHSAPPRQCPPQNYTITSACDIRRTSDGAIGAVGRIVQR